METVIVTSIILIAVGAFATFAMAQMLPQEVLAKAEDHGRFAGRKRRGVGGKAARHRAPRPKIMAQ